MLFRFTRVCYQWLWAEGWKLPQKMWCLSSEFVFWAQNSSFFFWIYPAILSQRPMVKAPTIWMDWRATSWHPHGHSQPVSFTFDLLSLENVLPLGLKQPKTPFPYHSPPSELSFWPALLFIHPVLSASISQEFLNILNPAVSPLLIFLCAYEFYFVF